MNWFVFVANKLKLHSSMIEYSDPPVAIFFQPRNRPIFVHKFLLIEVTSCRADDNMSYTIFGAFVLVDFTSPFVAMIMCPESQIDFVRVQQVLKQSLHICSHDVIAYIKDSNNL